MAGDLALASYHDLKGKMIMQVNMKKGNGKNSITSKQFNRGLIFQLIATGTCNTRIELSRRTGLAKTTVTNIVAEFMEKGIVKECEEELTEVCGRNPIILKVADQAPKIIGILVFRTNIQAVLCSLDMQIFRTETTAHSKQHSTFVKLRKHSLIFSGDASPILMASKVIG